MRKLNDINKQAVDTEVTSAILKAAQMLSAKATIEDAKAAWDIMKEKIIIHNGYLKVSELVAAIDNGSMGKYGTYTKINGLTVVNWIRARYEEMNKYKPSEESQQASRKSDEIEMAHWSYPKAVALRMKFNPGGLVEEFNDITLEEIAEGLTKGLNVFTGEPIDPQTINFQVKKVIRF